MLLRHTGTYVFDFQAQDQLYRDLHSLALQNNTALGNVIGAPTEVQPAPVAQAVTTVTPEAPKPVAKVLAKSKKDEPAPKAKAKAKK